jgi:hypothetical protein
MARREIAHDKKKYRRRKKKRIKLRCETQPQQRRGLEHMREK